MGEHKAGRLLAMNDGPGDLGTEEREIEGETCMTAVDIEA